MVTILIFVESCQLFDFIHDISQWPRTGSNPADKIGFEAILKN